MDPARSAARELLRFIDRSPSPSHAVEQVVQRLTASGFQRLRESDDWHLSPGKGYYCIRDASSIVAFRVPQKLSPEAGIRVVGAHTDSPGFRIKPRALLSRSGLAELGVEIYGSPILPTFADRDLYPAGRLLLRSGDSLLPQLVALPNLVIRMVSPAIHLNREVNEQGLRFDAQEETPLILAALEEAVPSDDMLRRLLAEAADVAPDAIVAWELALAEIQPGGFFGSSEEFITSGRLDNLASCHAAVGALLAADAGSQLCMCALFDHEEVGSQSYKGADGTFLADVVARVLETAGMGDQQSRRRVLARSMMISADMAHAYHPNYPRYYDEQHSVRINGGPAIKINAKQRYATDGVGEAYFAELCAREGIPCQRYVHRNNLPCGSTIGPIGAAALGIRTIDVGNPMWSMHSARESAGAADHHLMIRALTAFFRDDAAPALD